MSAEGQGMRAPMRDGPDLLVLVRHGESVGNLADARAREVGAHHLDLDHRDADVELSDTGREQARSLARWLRGPGAREAPTAVVASPYRRAAETARIALEGSGVELVLDERLRERDLGLFDGLTGKGIRARYAEEAERRTKLGKFYYQPPSGESWADVVLRVRSLLRDLRDAYAGERVWLFTHQAVIMSFRYAVEGIEERALLDIDREVQIPNASLTRYRRHGEVLELAGFAETGPLDDEHARVTQEPSRGGDGDEQA